MSGRGPHQHSVPAGASLTPPFLLLIPWFQPCWCYLGASSLPDLSSGPSYGHIYCCTNFTSSPWPPPYLARMWPGRVTPLDLHWLIRLPLCQLANPGRPTCESQEQERRLMLPPFTAELFDVLQREASQLERRRRIVS